MPEAPFEKRLRLRCAGTCRVRGVITRLKDGGYTVLAAPNPLGSLSGDATYVRDILSTVAGPIVLVRHSYGGAVVTNAATGNPNAFGQYLPRRQALLAATQRPITLAARNETSAIPAWQTIASRCLLGT